MAANAGTGILIALSVALGLTGCESRSNEPGEPTETLVEKTPAPIPVSAPALAPEPAAAPPPPTPLVEAPFDPPTPKKASKRKRGERLPAFMYCGWPPTKKAGTRKLRLWNGKTKAQLGECLGKPDRKPTASKWRYSRGHCATLIEDLVVVFDSGKVARATATAKYNPNHCEL